MMMKHTNKTNYRVGQKGVVEREFQIVNKILIPFTVEKKWIQDQSCREKDEASTSILTIVEFTELLTEMIYKSISVNYDVKTHFKG